MPLDLVVTLAHSIYMLGFFTLGLLHGALVLAVFDYRGVPIHGILTLLAVWKGIMA